MTIYIVVGIGLALVAGIGTLGLHLQAREEAKARAYRAAADFRQRRNAVLLVALLFVALTFVVWLGTL